MKKLVSLIVAALTACSVFAACSAESNFNYWQITEKADGSGERLQYYAVVYMKDVSSSKKIREIWVNVSDMTADEVSFNMIFGSSSGESYLRYNEQKDLKVKKTVAADAEGWVKLCADLDISYKYAQITVSDTMHFNEMVFLTDDNATLDVSVSEAGERSPTNHSIKKTYDLSDENKDEHLADKLFDEQSSFDRAAAEKLYSDAVAKADK